MNIMDGMDAARFSSANPDDEVSKDRLNPASPQVAYGQMSQQPPLPQEPATEDELRNRSEKGHEA
ncbi:hypothetical protein [Cohnella caldifontis]|uniref:hypothetical protein n=1 Tax=Cohnella caldifontis TaxID=3027471 RepID=UPI0023EAF3A1|nr:hypothetical protein [Cohnella sp. YIM B05605]